MVLLKIPIVGLFLIVRWAVRQTPDMAGGAGGGGIGPRPWARHPPHPPPRAPPRARPRPPPPARPPAARAFARAHRDGPPAPASQLSHFARPAGTSLDVCA